MAVYIALLRGINVSGHKIIKMESLRASLTALGLAEVRTYVQSGNVIFNAPDQGLEGLARKLEQNIRETFGFDVPVFLITAKRLEEVIRQNPLARMPGIDPSKLHVTFLSGNPPKAAGELLGPLAVGAERLEVVGREVYLYCPNGYGDTKLSNTAIEKKLSVGATTRNWKTVNTLLEMAR